MGNKADVWQGTLVLMFAKEVETNCALHGYDIDRQLNRRRVDLLFSTFGPLYRVLLKLKHERHITSE